MTSEVPTLTAYPDQNQSGLYLVGLANPCHVFVPAAYTKNDEFMFCKVLRIKAASEKEAIQIATLQLLAGEHQIGIVGLWAWR